jgi:hypothetical protein
MMAKIQHNAFKTVYLPLDEFREENKIEENITIKESGEEIATEFNKNTLALADKSWEINAEPEMSKIKIFIFFILIKFELYRIANKYMAASSKFRPLLLSKRPSPY